ncbi:hypothetical protein GBAR_LOCUS14658, partial [Geodia barretti]
MVAAASCLESVTAILAGPASPAVKMRMNVWSTMVAVHTPATTQMVGSYQCSCHEGYTLAHNGSNCIDTPHMKKTSIVATSTTFYQA